MNQAEYHEAQSWLRRLTDQHEALSKDLHDHEKILSRYTINALKNDITRLEMHINDIEEVLQDN